MPLASLYWNMCLRNVYEVSKRLNTSHSRRLVQRRQTCKPSEVVCVAGCELCCNIFGRMVYIPRAILSVVYHILHVKDTLVIGNNRFSSWKYSYETS